MGSKKLHVAIVASPGMGHLTPMLLLGNRLVDHHDLHVTILHVTTDTSPAQAQLLTTFTHLPIIPVPAHDVSSIVAPDAKVVTLIGVIMRETLPSIRSTVASMDPRPNLLIGDIFATKSWAVADELGIPKYVFVTSNAWFTALFTYSTVLDKEVVGQYVDQSEPIQIPGCKPVRPEDVVDPMLDREDEVYRVYLDQAVGLTLSDGFLLNTWEDLEPQSLNALRSDVKLRSVIRNKPVYAIGPVCKEYDPVGLKSEVVEWLDKQPEESVIYVSFGSGGTMSAEQITELAWGLETSRQRFIWVVRPPLGQTADGCFFTPGSSGPDTHTGPLDYFPKGFLTRTQEIGLVIPLWAPQVEILNHTSIGGFMTHCGWNSTLESINSGVPMIAWPLYAEQGLNASMLTEELAVAIRPALLPTKKVVARQEVEQMVRGLMEGEEGKSTRKKVKELRDDAKKALNTDGSSYISICKFIEDCWSQM